ncbi:MAG: hypothetical protein QG592_1817, partial [Pseudomonadota bacterium]|nr:hypothetical protein [Pseudomonadota bacterium]
RESKRMYFRLGRVFESPAATTKKKPLR